MELWLKACLKLSKVGFAGIKFNPSLYSSSEGINATLKAYEQREHALQLPQ